MIRIVHLRDSSGIFGAERVILTLANNYNSTHLHISLICMDRGDGKNQQLYDFAKKIGINAFQIRVHGKFDLPAIMELRRALINMNVDIVHTHDFKSDLYALIATLGTRVQLVATAHGSTRDSLLKKIYLFFTEFFLYRFFNKIISVSDELKEYLLSLKLKPSRIVTISNGLDFSLISHESSQINEKPIEIPAGAKVFSIIGRLYPDKGHLYFLEAFRNLLPIKRNVFALIVGAGPFYDDVKETVHSYGLAQHVQMCGMRRDMDAIYRMTDYIIIPSLTEGLPYVLLEAMAYRIPILSTSVGDIPKLIRHGQTGYLVPAGNTERLLEYMIEMLEPGDSLKHMAQNAFELLEKEYSAKKMVKEIERIYFKLMDCTLER